MPASKWKIADTIESIQLFGDVRFRYEYRGANNLAGASPSTFYRERFRYAFRAGIRGDLFDDFNYGIRLETSTNPRSPWATFATPSSARCDLAMPIALTTLWAQAETTSTYRDSIRSRTTTSFRRTSRGGFNREWQCGF